MAQTFIILAGVVIFAALVQGQSSNEGTSPGGEIEKLLRKLEEGVNKGLEKANKTLTEASVKVQEYTDKTVKKSVSIMKIGEDKAKKELDGLKKKAAAAGVNIDDCINGNEARLLNLPNQLADQLVHCVSNCALNAIKQLQDAVNEIQKLVADLESIKAEGDKCKKDKKKEACLLKLVNRIKKDGVLLAKIQKDVAKAAASISTVEVKIATCGTTKTAEFNSDVTKILEPMVKCITKKLHK